MSDLATIRELLSAIRERAKRQGDGWLLEKSAQLAEQIQEREVEAWNGRQIDWLPTR